MKTTSIDLQIIGEVFTILLVAPEGKPPTLDAVVLQQLEQAIAQVREQQPKLVLLRSSSERFFCVGANLNVLKETNEATIVPWVMQGHRVLNLLEDLPMPVLAVVEGYAMGGGLELAMACDLIFSSDQAKFAQSEASLGFIPGWGGTRRLAERIGVAKAKYYFYSGKMLDAELAASVGLIDYVGSKEALDAELDGFAAAVIGNNSNALRQFKTILNQQQRAARAENASVEAFHSITCLQDADAKQRLSDFFNKRGQK
jgi:enoyl-CoA hydratase